MRSASILENGAARANVASTALTASKPPSLSTEKRECVELLRSCIGRVLQCKRRDLHLATLMHCISGASDADRDEPLSPDCFLQYRSYLHFTQQLRYFPEKFDYLCQCVLSGVCTVQKPYLFRSMIETLLLPPVEGLAQRLGGELLQNLIREDEMRKEDEEARVAAFCTRAEWSRRRGR